MSEKTIKLKKICADCGYAIGMDSGPDDGWQLEDGRTVCQRCCVVDTRCFVDKVLQRDFNERKNRTEITCQVVQLSIQAI